MLRHPFPPEPIVGPKNAQAQQLQCFGLRQNPQHQLVADDLDDAFRHDEMEDGQGQFGKLVPEAGQGCVKLVAPALGLRNPKAQDPKPKQILSSKPERARRLDGRERSTAPSEFGSRILFRISGFGFRAFVQAGQGFPCMLDAATPYQALHPFIIGN